MGRVLDVCKLMGIRICPHSLRQVLWWSGASSIACATCVQEQPILGASASIVSTALLHLLQQRGHGYVLVISTVRDATSYVLLRCRFAVSSAACQCFELLARFLALSQFRSHALQTADSHYVAYWIRSVNLLIFRMRPTSECSVGLSADCHGIN